VSYRIELRPAAIRALKQIDHRDRERIRGAIAFLGVDSRPPAAKPLRGRPTWRVRVGDYRIVHTIDDGVLLIVVVTPGHRRDVYER
jgi:mRNA interferase RelE/StbE